MGGCWRQVSGTSDHGTDRCQSHTGPWTDAHDALFAAGDFRIHNFQIGKRAAVLAVRGVWTFTDDEAIADLQRVVSIVRDFWHDDRFPYFLVTLKAFDQDQGSSDGTALTNAFWLYLSRKDPFSAQLTTLAHETFHAWNPRKMGVQPAGVNIDCRRSTLGSTSTRLARLSRSSRQAQQSAFQAGLRKQSGTDRHVLHQGSARQTCSIHRTGPTLVREIEDYPRGTPIVAPQFHLDDAAIAASPSGCGVKR